MKKSVALIGIISLAAGATVLLAQPPSPPGGRNRRGGDIVAASVSRMMAFDADQDGELSKSEVADPRLEALFERADVDKDGTVTKDELTALFTREASSQPRGPGGPNGRGGPPPGGGEDGGFGPPPGPPGGRPRPGEVLPRFLQDELQLTGRQRAQLEKLQAEVDTRLAKILTEEQLEQLNQMRNRRPGGPPP